MHVLKQIVDRPFSQFLLLAFLLIAAFSPTLFSVYGMADDYDTIIKFLETGTNQYTFFKSMRPIYALVADPIFYLVDARLEQFHWLRLIFILNMALFAWLLSNTLQRLDIALPTSLCISLMVAGSTASLAMISYGIMCLTPLAACCAVLAYRLVKPTESVLCWRMLPAAVLLAIGMSIYQIYPLFFWAMVIADILANPHPPRQLIARLLRFGFTFAAGMILYYGVAVLLIPDLMQLELSGRAAFAENPLYNLIYFVFRPLRDSLNLFTLSPYGPLLSAENYWSFIPSYASAVVVGLVTVVGLWRYLKYDRFFSIAVAAAVVIASYLPHLITENLFTPYRTQFALYGCIIMLLAFGLQGYTRSSRPLLALTVLSLGFTAYHAQNVLVAPLHQEWAYVYKRVQTLKEDNITAVTIIAPPEKVTEQRQTYYDDFNLSVTLTPHRLPLMVKTAARAQALPIDHFQTTIKTLPLNTPAVGKNIIDLRLLYQDGS